MARHDIKYNPKYAENLPKMFANGEDVIEVCNEIGISRQTFYVWLDKYPAFKEGYSRGKEKSEAWWLKAGRAGAVGKVKINPAVWIFMMKNKFGMRDQPINNDDEETNKANELNITFEVRDSVAEVNTTNAKPE